MHTKLARGLWSAILVAVLSSGVLAQSAAPSVKPAPERLVLCWYMVCFGNSVEFYKQEIELAQRHGIDGFLLDVGSWSGNYVGSTERMYEAAKQLNTGFKLAMAPEYSVQPFTEGVRDMVLKFRDHPNQLRHELTTAMQHLLRLAEAPHLSMSLVAISSPGKVLRVASN